MNLEDSLIKFTKMLAVSSSRSPGAEEYLKGFKQGQIPLRLLSEELTNEGISSVILNGEEYIKYQEVYAHLRQDPQAEHLNDKDLDDAFWMFVCEVVLNKQPFQKREFIEEKTDAFLDEIRKPLLTIEVAFKIEHFSMSGPEIPFWDCTIAQLSEDEMNQWVEGTKYPWVGQALPDFFDTPILFITETGNNMGLVHRRAREKALIRLNALQRYLSDCNFTIPEQLVFALSDSVIARIQNRSDTAFFMALRSFGPLQLDANESHLHAIQKGAEELQDLQKLSDDLHDVVSRAFYWIGQALSTDNQNGQVTNLFTALEALLCKKSDGLKGEIITYRTTILSSSIRGHFVEPTQILWMYGARSSVVHGSLVLPSASLKVGTLLYIVKQALSDFIQLAKAKGLSTQGEVIKALEESEEKRLLFAWLKENRPKLYKDIVKSIK